ncbi:MAG: ribonuclease III [Polyangiales bacterium]
MDEATRELVAALGHSFRDASLLHEALTHRSAAFEASSAKRGKALRDNERMEFLGDSVLALVVSDALWRSVPGAVEGELTRMRAAVVNERTLARVATELKLGDALRLGKGEERTGGRSKPSLLANALEALFAAVYLDGGIDAARPLIERLLAGELAEVTSRASGEERSNVDEKSMFQELIQARYGSTPRYEVVKTEGPDHDRLWTVEVIAAETIRAQGTGRSKKIAEQQAARRARESIAAAPAPGAPPDRG